MTVKTFTVHVPITDFRGFKLFLQSVSESKTCPDFAFTFHFPDAQKFSRDEAMVAAINVKEFYGNTSIFVESHYGYDDSERIEIR